MNKRDNNMVPLVCGALTLIGAVVWTSSVIVIGFAAVALWEPVAALARRVARAVPPAGPAPRSTGARSA